MRKVFDKLYIALIIVFLYAPIVVLIAFSFNESKSRANFTNFSLIWYQELFSDPTILSALKNTLLIAIISAIISTIIGTLAALGINSMKKLSKGIILKITNLPVLNPDIVTGVSLMILYVSIFKIFGNKGSLGFATILISHITFNIPYVILSVLPKIRQLDNSLFEAALDLGATPFFAYKNIVIPELLPGIITGAILAFTLSLDDFIVSFFTTGSGVNTISTLVYSMTKQSINPKINALSTLLFVAVLFLLYLVNIRNKNDNKKLKTK